VSCTSGITAIIGGCGGFDGCSRSTAAPKSNAAGIAKKTVFFMTRAILACFVAALMTCPGAALARLDRITATDAAAGLKAALEKGSNAAVARLGRTDGFLGDARVRIPLPESMQGAEKLMRRFGMGKHADELVVALNRAAEAAVPEARQLLVDSVRRMTLQDAKGILQGGETAATDYFRASTEERLRGRFLPMVRRATAKVGLAQHYNRYAEKGVALGLVTEEDANLDAYVTEKAVAGLFLALAEEEKKIRSDPAAAGTAIIRRVFGALR
jgi:hypothetical protein